MAGYENLRNTKPISLAPLTTDEALRRAMSVPPPERDPLAPKAAKRGAKKPARKPIKKGNK